MKRSLFLALCLLAAVPSGGRALSPGGAFMVFFHSGNADLSPPAVATIGEFAKVYRSRHLAENELIVLNANTDSAEANEALSQARGERVRRSLVEAGVPVERIIVFAHAERRPLVVRPPGSGEPQNRRVEISYLTPRAGVASSG